MVAIARQSHILSCQAWRKGRSPQSGLQKLPRGLPPTPPTASFYFLTSSLPWSLCSSLGAGRGLCTGPSASLLFHQQFPSVIFLTLVKISAQMNTSQCPNLTIRIKSDRLPSPGHSSGPQRQKMESPNLGFPCELRLVTGHVPCMECLLHLKRNDLCCPPVLLSFLACIPLRG